MTWQLPSNYSSLTVTWYDATDSYSTTANITPDVKAIPLFTDTGTGEVNQARIILRALDGKYIVSGNIIDVYDRFHITCTDLGGNVYNRFFEVIDMIPSQGKGEGTLLTIDCLGIEYHLQHIHCSKPYYFENAFNVLKDLGDIYNENRGSLQPELTNNNTDWDTINGNGLPKFTSNNYEFGIAEDKVYNRMLDVVDKLGASVDAGGALTFYDLSFRAITKDTITMRARQSGDNTSFVTVKNAKVTNPKTVGEQEGMLSNPTGTNVLAWGSSEHGTLPVDYSKYFSGTEYFYFRPEWDNTVTYPQNAKVKVTDTTNKTEKHYKSDINNNTSTPPTNWTQFDMSDSVGEVNGDNVQYSPWTDGKSQYWKNSMANPRGATQFAWDQNIVIWDEGFFRTWVNARATSNAALDLLATSGNGYSYNGTRTGLPRGFRVLVNGTGSGVLANFDNMVVEWTGSEWRKKYQFEGDASDVTVNSKVQVAVLDEGKIYEDTITAGPTHSWASLDSSQLGNDCFHPITSVTEVDGFDKINNIERAAYTDSSSVTGRPDITKAGAAFSQNIDSALKFTYQWTNIGTDIVNSLDTQTGSYYKKGAWACFQLPYPVCDYNSVGTVGNLYYPATLDVQNMHNTSNNNRGYNQGDESEDLGTINGIAFWINFTNNFDANANDLFRVFMIDTSDNIVYADFNIEFRNHWEDIWIPISTFKSYRGRIPAYGAKNLIDMKVPKELNNVNQFEWRNVKFVGIQWQVSYDEFGRYNPLDTIIENGNVVLLGQHIGGGTIDLYIDGFRFTKPLLVTSGQDSTRNLEPNFLQRSNISNYWQLKNDVLAQLEIEKFQHMEFNIESSGDDIFDINFADSFLLENDQLVYVASPDSDETTNKIKLVAKRIEYSITKPREGNGGLRRRMNGSKVFT